MTDRPLIAITLGDPAGIGPEVAVKALQRDELRSQARLFLLGSPTSVAAALRLIGSTHELRPVRRPESVRGGPGTTEVLAVGGFREDYFAMGEHSVVAGEASHVWVEEAAKLALAGEVEAIVTAPINKESWQMAGSSDTGHQEVFQRLSGSGHVATMLVSGGLRCMHLSTHKTLAEACAYVTRENVLEAIRLTDRHFREWGFAEPRIGVAALNPHAGDGGLMGTEELTEIGPAVEDARGGGDRGDGPGSGGLGLSAGGRGALRRGGRDVPRPRAHRDQGARLREIHQREPGTALHPHVGRPRHGVRHRGHGGGGRDEHGGGDHGGDPADEAPGPGLGKGTSFTPRGAERSSALNLLRPQNMARGLAGLPVPPLTRRGERTNWNSQRPSRSQVSASCSRLQLSMRWRPMAVRLTMCTGWFISV